MGVPELWVWICLLALAQDHAPPDESRPDGKRSATRRTVDESRVLSAGNLDAEEDGTVVRALVKVVDQADIPVWRHRREKLCQRAPAPETRSGKSAVSSLAVTPTVVSATAGTGGNADAPIEAETLSHNLGTTNVSLINTPGGLMAGDAVSWTSDNALSLTLREGNVNLNASLAPHSRATAIRW